jgi:flavorubredoxin
MSQSSTTIDEIADGIFRISTWVPDVTPEGFTFNQFLVLADEPMLFHTGMRAIFPLVADAVSSVMATESLRWISFGHVEGDECGAMNLWLASSPQCQVAFGALGCELSLDDLCDRPPRPLSEGEVLDLGGRRVRQISTPHLPHGWEAQVLFEETTGTLFCGDVFSQVGRPPAVTHQDIVEPALAAERIFGATALTPHAPRMLRRLGDLGATTLAVMHGSSFRGDTRRAFDDLATGYEGLLAEAGSLPDA